jgi:hypothetical protein
MKNVKLTCKKTFEKALADRRASPLPSGVYKLKNARDWLEDSLDGVQTVDLFKIARGNARNEVARHLAFEHCQPDEIPSWLAEKPTFVAWVLGWAVVPALAALPGDGVPPHVADTMRRAATPTIADMVDRLDTHPEGLEVPLRAALHFINQVLNDVSERNCLPLRWTRSPSGRWKRPKS